MKRPRLDGASPASDPIFVPVDLPEDAAGAAGRGRIYAAQFPTTVSEYRVFVEKGGYKTKGWWSQRGWFWREEHGITAPNFWGWPKYDASNLPITGVSFWEAEAYARFRNAALPSEQEWYLLSSNGGVSRFPWGDDGASPSNERAHLTFFGHYDSENPGRVPVEESIYSSSRAGVRDLIGNVGEWCLPSSHRDLPPGATTGVLRGGAAWHVPGVADSSFRDVVPLSVRDNQTGIRLIRRVGFTPSTVAGSSIGWPVPRRRLGRSIPRPTIPFRHEGMPVGLQEDTWRLKVHGDVIQPNEFTLTELKNLVTRVDRGLFVCVCRWGEVNSFKGVQLRTLLEACGVTPAILRDLYLRQVSTVGQREEKPPTTYETTVPLSEALDHGALLAWEMDGRELTPELGWPIRYVDLHLYGYKCVKSLSELVITDEYRRGWWERACEYDVYGTIQPGTITVVGDDAMRFDIEGRGRVAWTDAPRGDKIDDAT
jgi:gamma-glutamyl hercynylcysteine S-oxide synthase